MKGIFLLLGSNLGNRLENLRQARDILTAHETNVIHYSSVYESAPWGDEDQDWFLNVVLRVESIHSPESLLQVCMDTEVQMGRQRLKKWAARIIDVDILYYNDEIIQTEDLIVPHPGISLRRFTLIPLNELIPTEIHPVLVRSQKELLEICPDTLVCRRYNQNLQ